MSDLEIEIVCLQAKVDMQAEQLRKAIVLLERTRMAITPIGMYPLQDDIDDYLEMAEVK